MNMESRRHPDPLLTSDQIAVLRESLRAELQQHPEWADLWNLKGLLDVVDGRPEDGHAAFAKSLEINPNWATARWNLRWVELLLGSEPTAEGAKGATDRASRAPALQCESLLAVVADLRRDAPPRFAPDSERASLAFAELAVAAAGRGEETVADVETRLAGTWPELPEMLEVAGLSDAQGLAVGALAELGVPERLNPSLSSLLRHAARHEERAGRDEEATRLYALAGLYSGEPAMVLSDRAAILSRNGKAEEALALLERAVAIDPEAHEPRIALGWELSAQGRPGDALVHLEKAAELRGHYPDVLYQLGLLYDALGRSDDAVRTVERALEQNPSYLAARIALANLFFESGREAEACPHYERLFEAGLDSPLIAGRFGCALHAAGCRTRAEEIFLEALARDRDRPELLALYGLFLAETDRKLEAGTVWARALEVGAEGELRQSILELREKIAAEDRAD
jgi:tetratricopeptide (TPR) repeat protein